METWTPKAPMEYKRANFNTNVINNKIYAFGGKDDQGEYVPTIEKYDPVTNTWISKAFLLTKRMFFQSQVIDGKIYTIGGFTSAGSNNFALAELEVYDSTTNTCTKLASMTTARTAFQTAVINGKIYAIGGESNNGSVEVYDPATNTWTALASMKTARTEFQTAAINGKIYAIGGIGNGNRLASTEIYDPSTNTWTTAASMYAARAGFQSEVIDGKIYVIGGNALSGNLNSVEVYDSTTNTWSKLASMKTARTVFQTAVINGKIYAIGGTCLSSVEIYDPSTNTWTNLPSMSVARSRGQVEVINGRLYAIGGFISGNASPIAAVEALSVTATNIETPPLLTASGRDFNVDLSWSAVTEATSYNVYRALTSGGPYTQIATGVLGTTYTDSTVTNGTTYYYVVTAVSSDGESAYSNEASATPKSDESGGNDPGGDKSGNALLDIYMVDGTLKEYDLVITEVNAFIEWYDQRAAGTGNAYFIFGKTYNKGPFTARKDYIVFDKIRDFEVNQYA